MPTSRAYAPPQKRPARKPPAPVQAVQRSPDPTVEVASMEQLVGLQRLIGNRAIQASVVTQKPHQRAVSRKPDLVSRLYSKAEFKAATDAGFLSGRGKTMKQLDALLGEFDEIKKTGKHLLPGAQQDRAINILHEVAEDVQIWMDTHKGDKSRSKKRIPGLTKLLADANKERVELEGIREKGREFMGEKQEPVTRTENTFKTQMEGNFTSILAKLGPILSAAIPQSGDTGEVEVQVKVPCEPSGVGYLGFRLKIQLERLKKTATKLRFELAVVGGAKIGNVAEIGGELGMYLESQGATPEKALELISYGIYRRFRESKVIPNEVANFIWGGSGTAVGWNRAEKWSAKVEKENFKDKSSFAPSDSDEAGAFVETGGLLGAKAKGGVGGVVELEGQGQFRTGQKYDHDSVKHLKQKHGGELGKPDEAPTMRGQTHHLGESVHHLEFGFGAKGGPFSGALKVGIDWSTQKRNPGPAKLQAIKAQLEASASIPMNELIAGGVAGAVPPIAASVIKGIRQAAQGAKTQDSQDVGEIVGHVENGASALAQISAIPTTAWVPKFEVGQPPPGFTAPAELKLSVQGTYDFFEKKWIWEFKLEYIKGIEVNAGVFELKIKKGQRIVRVYYDGGWNVD